MHPDGLPRERATLKDALRRPRPGAHVGCRRRGRDRREAEAIRRALNFRAGTQVVINARGEGCGPSANPAVEHFASGNRIGSSPVQTAHATAGTSIHGQHRHDWLRQPFLAAVFPTRKAGAHVYVYSDA